MYDGSSYGQGETKARVVQGKRERPSVTRAYQSLADRQGAPDERSQEYGLKRAPRPRSNVRSNQRASVRPSRPEAAASQFGATFLGLKDFASGPSAVTSHRYEAAPQQIGSIQTSNKGQLTSM